ncbi:MAG: hypothetical protein Q8K99_14355 [Actinomycetota bacterium]|nr:hypothetical protein [Actinomycetota bacterium]
MTDDRLPPDPWAEEGVDLWALEQAEELAHDGVHPDDRAWDNLDGGPTIDEFDDAAAELRALEGDPLDNVGSLIAPDSRRGGHLVALAFGALAILVAVALVLLVVR